MARIGRLGGALLVQTDNTFYLVGNLKEPCNFAAAGFEPPGEELDAVKQPFVRLLPRQTAAVRTPCLEANIEGEAVPRLLAERLLIARNGSVSERLWHLFNTQTHLGPPAQPVEVSWLFQMPKPIWDIVRDTVLRCA